MPLKIMSRCYLWVGSWIFLSLQKKINVTFLKYFLYLIELQNSGFFVGTTRAFRKEQELKNE